MSVAASLALMRASASAAPSRRSAPPMPRRDLAGLALNGLDTLSTIDPILPSLAPSLLLLPPYSDRATLSPEEAEAVSSAVISLVGRLAPVFPLRPAQKLMSWLIHGLRVQDLGAEGEVDAVMLAALPFHATPQFVELTVEVLRSRKWKKWEWLRPVAKQKKPPALEFVVRDCPESVVRLAVDAAVEAVRGGVNAVAGAGFLANVLVRSLCWKEASARRELLLAIVAALEKANHVKAKEQAKQDLLCAFMSALAAAVPARMETDVAQAAAQAIAKVIRSAEVKSPTSDTAAACLALLVTKAGVVSLGKDVSRGLVGDDLLTIVLPRLGDEELVTATYAAVIMGLVTKAGVRMLGFLEKALSNNNAALLSEGSVAKALIRLLDVLSLPVSDDDETVEKKEAILEKFVSLLATLARGRFAGGVDIALRDHLNSRKKKKSERTRYAFVDDGIGKALSGTPFEVIKESVRKPRLPEGDTVLAMLAHPEPSVRKAALAKLVDAEYAWDDQSDNVTTKVVEKCSELLEHDPDAHVAADAAMCILQAPDQHIPENLLKYIFSRFREAHTLFLKKKKKKKSRLASVLALATPLVSVGERWYVQEASQVQTMFIGLVREGALREDSILSGKADLAGRVKSLLSRDGAQLDLSSVNEGEKGSVEQDLDSALKAKIEERSWDCESLVKALSVWEPAWAADILSLWLTHLGDQPRKAKATASGLHILKSMISLYEDFDIVRENVLELTVKAVKPLCAASASKSVLATRLDQIWELSTRGEDERLCKRVLQEINSCIKLDDVRDMLRRGISLSRESHDALRLTSLRWFLALCENDPSDDLRREAISILLCSHYVDDNKLREGVRSSCVARKAALGTSKTNLPLDIVYASLENVEQPAEAETSSEGTDKLLKLALSRFRGRHGYSSPLSSQGPSEKLGVVHRHAVERIMERRVAVAERLYLLRAIEDVNGLEDSDMRNMFRSLTDLLPKLQTDVSTGLIPESVTRLTLLLTRAKPGVISSKAINAAVKAANTLLQAARRDTSSSQWQSREVQFALVSAAAQIFLMCGALNLGDEKHTLMGHLLSFSTKSSPAGMFAMQVLDVVLVHDNADELETFLEVFGCIVDAKDKTVVQQTGTDDTKSLDVAREAGLGAVEAMKRMLTNSLKDNSPVRINPRPIMTSLWAFVRTATSATSGEGKVNNSLEYELQSVLSLLTILHRRESQNGIQEAHVDFDALTDAVFYPHLSRADPESALIRSVRAQSLEIVQVLAPFYGEQQVTRLGAVLERQVGDKSLTGSLRSVHRLAPVLLKSGCEFRWICNLLTRAAYSEAVRNSAKEEDRQLIASCCLLMSDVKSALIECMQEVSRHTAEYLPLPVIAKECSSLLLAVEQSVMADLSVISHLDDGLKCELALVYTLQPKFSAKLAETLKTGSSEPEVFSAFTQLLQALWHSDSEGRDKSVAAVVALLPLPALGTCFVDTLSKMNSRLRFRALRSLSERLEDGVPLSPTWNFEESEAGERKASKSRFVESVGTALCDVIVQSTEQDISLEGTRSVELTLLALTCVRRVADRIGSSAPHALLKICATPLKLLDDSRTVAAISIAGADEAWCSCISEALSCLSSMVVLLGKYSVTFVPKILGVSASILESGFGVKDVPNKDKLVMRTTSFTAITESAMRTCTTVLDYNARFFGRNVLKSIATLAVSANVNELNALLLDASRKAPPSVTLGALAAVTDNLVEVRASLGGVATLLKGVAVVTEMISKTELKVRNARLITLLLTCLEFGRIGGQTSVGVQEEGVVNGTLINESKVEPFKQLLISSGPQTFLSACQLVDENCAEAITRVVLRISESDFKGVFNSVVQWLEGGRPATDLDSAGPLQIPQNLLRGVPVFRISLSLMQTLQTIFVPYFLQILDKVLDVIRIKRPGASSQQTQEFLSTPIGSRDNAKKRKRTEWEGDETEARRQVIVGLQNEMYEVALDNLVQFLKLDLASNIATPAVVSKIQASLVSACGNEGKSEKVRTAFDALGTRIVAVGNKKDSKEESRELLIALSRAILALSGEADPAVREASMYYCKSLASTIGDEYLVTLPEALPVLSELIDDEIDSVRRETRAFVKVLEALSGESIMEEMKS